MNQFKISVRLTVLVGILSVMLIAGAAMGLYGITKANAALHTVYVDRTVPLGQLAEISRISTRNALLIASGLGDPQEAKVQKIVAEVGSNIASVDKIWAEYLSSKLTAEEKNLADKFAPLLAKFNKQGIEKATLAQEQRAFDDEGPDSGSD